MADKQVVLITGSNKGIGLALALQYSEAGYKVSLLHLDYALGFTY
jgi:NAD(P)-dependent dehydrogenase (short-subunit alcohol dehydrogenase family)